MPDRYPRNVAEDAQHADGTEQNSVQAELYLQASESIARPCDQAGLTRHGFLNFSRLTFHLQLFQCGHSHACFVEHAAQAAGVDPSARRLKIVTRSTCSHDVHWELHVISAHP